MKTASEIAQLFWDYRSEDFDRKLEMRRVANSADGTVVIPLPELNASEAPAVANLTLKGIQGYAQRFSSVQPEVGFLPTKLTKEARKLALHQTRRVQWWWQQDKMALLDAQAGRYMFGYATAPSRTDIDLVAGRPIVSLPSPLGVYCPRPSQVNDMRPAHGIAARQMDVASIKKRWPNHTDVMRVLADAKPGMLRWVLEYADANETTLVMCGEAADRFDAFGMPDRSGEPVLLGQAPNRAETCPWVAPGLIHLNKPQGHFDQLIGMYQAQGLLTALELQQAARTVFQETWVVARPGEMPNIVTQADPMRGVLGEISGGDIRTIAPDAQYNNHLLQDRLAEAQRVTGGLPAEFGGQAASNVRTGRRANQLVDAAVDPSLGEAQTTWAIAKEEMIKVGAAYERAYLKQSRTFAVKFGGRKAAFEVVPSELWDGDVEPFVSYPMAGSDVNSLAILVGQAQGMGLLSTETARKMMPFIEDPEGERDNLVAEKLESVFLESLAGMIADPQSPLQPRHWADLMNRVQNKDEDLLQAFTAVQAAAQEEQAATVEPNTPESMPGLDGAGAIPPSIAGPEQGSQNLASLLGALRMPERQVGLSSGGRA